MSGRAVDPAGAARPAGKVKEGGGAVPGHAIGVDIGGTKILAVVVAADRPTEVVAEAELPTGRGVAAVAEAIIEVVDRVADAAGATGAVPPLGIGMPGLVTRAGVLRYGANLPGVLDTDMAALVTAGLGRRAPRVVAVDNDGNCAAWAEHRMACDAQRAGGPTGRGGEVDDFVFVGLGTGVSCGLVVAGRPVRGGHGFAGEPGHMCVDRNGPRCACGRDGCWEALASGTALARIATEHAAAGRAPTVLRRAGGDLGRLRGEHVTAVLREDPHDVGAGEIVAEFAAGVAVGLDAVVNLLDPTLVVLGGSVMIAADVLLGPIRTAYASIALGGDLRPELALRAARLGRRAGAIGAALLAFDAASAPQNTM